MNISNLFVPKSRKVIFKAIFTIHDLVNIPHLTGQYYTKWKLKSGGSFHGKTEKIPINEHAVSWEKEFIIDNLTMVIGKDGELMPCILSFTIRKQEVSIGKQQESIGTVDINLAEFAGSRINTRRYLLQESKINSTIKISLELIYIKGEHVFKTPSSKSAGEITNIFQPQELANNITAPRENQSNINYQFMSLNHNIISKEGESATKVIDELFASNTMLNE